MSSTSPRIGFELPSASDPMSTGDLVLSNNYLRLDEVIGVTFVTSGTRPSSPFLGQTIYESDTLRYKMWDGSQWANFGSLGIGSIESIVTSNIQSSAITTTETMITDMSATFDAVTGATYAIIWSMDWRPTVGSYPDVTIRTRFAAGASVTTGGTLISSIRDILYSDSSALTGTSMGRTWPGAVGWVSPVTGQVTIGLSAQTSTATIVFGGTLHGNAVPRTMIVERL